MIIEPTHTCFDDALDYFELLLRAGTARELILGHVVVHAVCCAPDGEHYVHAWVELADEVIQCGIVAGERVYYSMSRAELGTAIPIVEETRYTVREAYEENCRTGHYGPWVERYRELCAKGDRRVWRQQG